MFSFRVRTRQNSWSGSPGSVNSPASVNSPSHIESPKVANSPAEIDTSAPFQSVRAAVSLFRDVGSPSTRPLTKKSKAEERVLEKETQHHMILRELDYYKHMLRSAEHAKSQALDDLQRANRTLQELANKLENLSESKQAAIKATEEAKARARELEEHKYLKDQLGSDAWKVDVDSERESHKSTAGELIASKQNLRNLKLDFDSALEAKLAAFQGAEEARQSIKTNEERKELLLKEVSMMRQTLDQVSCASLEAEDENLKLIAEREVRVIVHKSAKEEAEREIKRLREEYDVEENLEEKLEETNEAIKVLQDQLKDVRASDLCSLKSVVFDLENAKKTLQEVVEEEASIRSSVDLLRSQLEATKRECKESEKNASDTEARIDQMRGELDTLRAELDTIMSRNLFDDMQSNLQNLLAEVENDTHEAERIKRDVAILKHETELSEISAKETEQKLEVALQEAEAAKLAVKLADDKIRDSPRTDSKGSESARKIRLSVQEFESMKKNIEETNNEADMKVATAMAQVDTIKANENQALQKIGDVSKENEYLQSEIEDALKRAEMAEAAKKIVEDELNKWRQREQFEVGETSGEK